MVLPTEREVHDPDALVALIGRAGVSHTLMVPTLYQALLERDGDAAWPRRVIVAGEACSVEVARGHRAALPQCALFNEYGPTEATVWWSCPAEPVRPSWAWV